MSLGGAVHAVGLESLRHGVREAGQHPRHGGYDLAEDARQLLQHGGVDALDHGADVVRDVADGVQQLLRYLAHVDVLAAEGREPVLPRALHHRQRAGDGLGRFRGGVAQEAEVIDALLEHLRDGLLVLCHGHVGERLVLLGQEARGLRLGQELLGGSRQDARELVGD